MASRTRSERRTGSSSLSSSLLCWRSACQPATASNPATPLVHAGHWPVRYVHQMMSPKWNTPQPSSGSDETPSSLINNDTFCSQIIFSDPESHFNRFIISSACICSHDVVQKCLLCSCVCLSPRLMKGRVTGELIALPRTWGETRAGGTWLALTLHSADSLHFPSPVALFVSLREGGRRVVGVGRVNWGYTHTSRIKRLTKSKMLKSDFSPTAPQGF